MEADVVSTVPESATPAAMGYADVSGEKLIPCHDSIVNPGCKTMHRKITLVTDGMKITM